MRRQCQFTVKRPKYTMKAALSGNHLLKYQPATKRFLLLVLGSGQPQTNYLRKQQLM